MPRPHRDRIRAAALTALLAGVAVLIVVGVAGGFNLPAILGGMLLGGVGTVLLARRYW